MHPRSRNPLHRSLLALTTSLALAVPLAGAVVASPPAAQAASTQPADRRITYHQWTTQRELREGRFVGTRAVRGTLQMTDPVATRRFPARRAGRFDVGRWISRWQRPGYAFDELIPSWQGFTPRGSWVRIQVRGRSEAGRRSKWYTMADWSSTDRKFRRTSLGPQADDLAQVNVDTLRTRYSVGFTSWQMRVVMMRPAGTRIVPRLHTIGAMTSALPQVDRVRPTRPGVARGITLDLPGYSQMTHQGDYPKYDGGGEAWCSPTSVSMVLGYLDRLPRPRAYGWVPADHHDRWVDHAARSQYDYGYQGAGNWSFSTAYAGLNADAAFVTRLRHLREAERFIKAGIPLVASVAFDRGELTGAPIRATNGHLLVISGFTEDGDVVVNDPAAPDNDSVVRVYDRAEFANAWLPTSGGLVYVIRNNDQPLPPGRATNW